MKPTNIIICGKMLAKVDAKGRIYLKGRLRDRLGSEVYVVELDEGILILPKPEDPVQDLGSIGRGLPDRAIKELREEIAKAAERDAA